MAKETGSNLITKDRALAVSGVVIMLLLTILGSIIKSEVAEKSAIIEKHEVRIAVIEKQLVRYDVEFKQIQSSLKRLERHFGTLPDSAR